MNTSGALYQIFRSTDPSSFGPNPYKTAAYTVTSYVDNVCYGGIPITYYYKMRAVDAGGNPSAYSNIVSTAPSKIAAPSGEVEIDQPFAFVLHQNCPNPANPTALIEYTIPSDVHVVLSVHDILGRQVAILVDGFEKAGTKSIKFDASNLPSGVYFYRLTAGSFTDIKKMALVR